MTTRILLCLLTFATSAQAESAWVLWSQMSGTVEKELVRCAWQNSTPRTAYRWCITLSRSIIRSFVPRSETNPS
jgi:hypothetical protein